MITGDVPRIDATAFMEYAFGAFNVLDLWFLVAIIIFVWFVGVIWQQRRHFRATFRRKEYIPRRRRNITRIKRR